MITTDTTALVVIDVQGTLAHSMYNTPDLFGTLQLLIKAANILAVPIILTEQYPRGLGHTVDDIANLLTNTPPISKVAFSCCHEETFMQALKACSRPNLLVCGIEAHICVYQTTRDLLLHNYHVEVVADAVSSRTRQNYEVGIARMREHGAAITSAEMAIYELLQRAGTPTFKEILQLVK